MFKLIELEPKYLDIFKALARLLFFLRKNRIFMNIKINKKSPKVIFYKTYASNAGSRSRLDKIFSGADGRVKINSEKIQVITKVDEFEFNKFDYKKGIAYTYYLSIYK